MIDIDAIRYSKINRERTAKNIKALRAKHGLSVSDILLAVRLCNPRTIYEWENGKKLPTLEHFVTLTDVYQCDIEDILVVELEKTI